MQTTDYVAASIEEQETSSRLHSLDDVKAAWEVFTLAVANWDQNPAVPMVAWKQGVSRSFEPLEPAIFALADFVDHCEFEVDAWHSVLAIDKFLERTFEWASNVKNLGDIVDPSGGMEVWNAYHEVPIALAFRISDAIEPVSQLLQLPGITAQQVAKIYGWKDPIGNWDVNKVEEEKLSPGKHTANWRNPAKVAHEAVTTDRWKTRVSMHPDYAGRLHIFNGEAPKPTKIQSQAAKESFEELLSLPGMTLEQCAKMKQCSVEEVRTVAMQLAIANDDIARMMAGEITAMHLRDPAVMQADNRLKAANMETYPGLELNERIWAMSDDGATAGKITAGLRAHHTIVSYDQVVAILSTRPKLEVAENGEKGAKEKTPEPAQTPVEPDSEAQPPARVGKAAKAKRRN